MVMVRRNKIAPVLQMIMRRIKTGRIILNTEIFRIGSGEAFSAESKKIV
ncbi:38004_t:CDS:2 [Gigaspora margarita]|uniref:38004_t:CDS:1 n=1 Tax=Gigaspora margarita TaxID=4874 RepID=A0ABN7UF36_GIGMA|nr:38004_t:CDS:2 [Gigaspora margarita]